MAMLPLKSSCNEQRAVC